MHAALSRKAAVGLGILMLVAPACATPSERFDLIAEESNPKGTQITRTRFDLIARGAERHVVVQDYRISEGGTWSTPAIGEACRRTFAAPKGSLGQVRVVPPQEDVNDLAPHCIPEPLFGAMTDIASFAAIAFAPSFRSADLRTVGQKLPLEPFRTSWRRPPSLVEAKLASAGGFIRLQSLGSGKKTVVWTPGEMTISMKRDIGGGRIAIFRGTEKIELEVDIDRASGRLLSGRSLKDELDLEMTMPGLSAPLKVRIERRLSLRASRDPA